MLAALLTKGALDLDEVDQLKGWLNTLDEDIMLFGETPQDYNLRRQIKAKLSEIQTPE